MNKQILLLTLALGASTCLLTAQDNNPPPGGQRPPPRQDGPGGPGGMGGQRPMNAVIDALDLNHDGIIDADEIAKASESLKKLDKNGDGKLTPDEYRPRPGVMGGPGRPGGQGGPGRRGGGPGEGGPDDQGGQQRPPVEK